MRFAAIIQARMGSTRLPGKILTDLMGKPALARQIERLKYSKKISEIVIATTDLPQDQAVADFAKGLGLRFFRGSENDVLDRYFQCAISFGLTEGLVRLTSDCPLIDPEVTDNTISHFEVLSPHIDYVANTIERTFPRGLDTEVFTFTALKRAYAETADPAWREHVTPIFYKSKGLFRVGSYKAKEDHSDLRLTLDTSEDLELIRKVYEHLYSNEKPMFGLKEIVTLFKRHPELKEINREIHQKEMK